MNSVGCFLRESRPVVRSEATVLLSVLLHSSVPAFLSPAFSHTTVGRAEREERVSSQVSQSVEAATTT